MTDMDALTFAQGFLARGMEFVLHGRRLHVWPAQAWRHLTDEERTFIRRHRAALKELAASKVLPEATVVWSPPSDTAESDGTATAAPVATCPFCQRPCVGEAHELYEALHWRDPVQVAKRNAEATAVMKRTVGRASPY